MLAVGDDQMIELFGPGTGGRALTNPPVVAFEVDDVAAAREELMARRLRRSAISGAGTGSNGCISAVPTIMSMS